MFLFWGLVPGFPGCADRVRAERAWPEGREQHGIRAETPHPVIDILPEAEKKSSGLGGNMRLGGKDVELIPGTIAYKIHGEGKKQSGGASGTGSSATPEYIGQFEKEGVCFFRERHPASR